MTFRQRHHENISWEGFLVDLTYFHKSLSLSTHSSQDPVLHASIYLRIYVNRAHLRCIMYTRASRRVVPFGLYPKIPMIYRVEVSKLSVKDQTVISLGFMDLVSVTITQLCCYSIEATMGNK